MEKPAPCSSARRADAAHELHLMFYTIRDRIVSNADVAISAQSGGSFRGRDTTVTRSSPMARLPLEGLQTFDCHIILPYREY